MDPTKKPLALEAGEIAANGRGRDTERMLELLDGLESAVSERPENRDTAIAGMHKAIESDLRCHFNHFRSK